MERVEYHCCFGGRQAVYQHESTSLHCTMKFAIYIPPQVNKDTFPVLYWLSGLSCTEQNFIAKSGVQRYAAEHGIMIVVPDTSPRGDQVSDDEDYDLGKGAGFYVNATQSPWCTHYHMYDYVVKELPTLIEANFPANSMRSISGHSMGGHAALMIALRNPARYQSVSAFSPIVAPSQVPWGKKAFMSYLGENCETWKQYDACELVQAAQEKLPMLIDQGDKDEFLDEQLKPELFKQAALISNYPFIFRSQPGYDHSYYFIASFIGDHIAHHAQFLHRSELHS